MDTRWPIERSWLVLDDKGAQQQLASNELLQYRGCTMLGAAGLGKTYELRLLAGIDEARGLDVRYHRLAVLGQTPDGLASQLNALLQSADANTVIYLDALDEVMVPVRAAGLVLQSWVVDHLAAAGVSLRISCRPAVWPAILGEALRETFGKEASRVALLQPLSLDDIPRIVAKFDIDPVTFVESIESAGASVLAQKPLTLEMLLRIYRSDGSLPESRRELFARGVEILAVERVERVEVGTDFRVSLPELLKGAERLACFTLLSGKDSVDLSDFPLATAIGRLELESSRDSACPLTLDLVQAICRCGLCDSDGSSQFRFAHRQFAEYLAGRRLASLLLHQSRAALGSGVGWHAGVAGPLRETAAFAAMESPEIATWITDSDPEVIGLSDVADETLRRQATLNLLSKFRTHELTDAQLDYREGIELSGLKYAGAEDDLRPVLLERFEHCADVVEFAVKLVESWQLSSMSDELATLALDADAPRTARRAAAYALLRIGEPSARRRLKPLIADRSDDPDRDLKAIALKCVWPGMLTTRELLAALTPPPDDGYHGSYFGFFISLDRQRFDAADDRVAGLSWARQFVNYPAARELPGRIAKRIAIAAVDHVENPDIAAALADLLWEAARSYEFSPLAPPDRRSWDNDEPNDHTPVLEGKLQARRILLDRLTAKDWKDGELRSLAYHTPGLLDVEDFQWLLQRATDSAYTLARRESFATFARILPWMDNDANVQAYLQVREIEPIASCFNCPLSMDLGSEQAAVAKKNYIEAQRSYRPPRVRKVRPVPRERIERVLAKCETQDPRFFLNLCNELTLDEHNEQYGFERFLSNTPGWHSANASTRQRIIDAAKRLLDADLKDVEKAFSEPMKTFLPGYLSAIWLLEECDPAWCKSQPADWWTRWTRFIVRELRPSLMDEPDEPKTELLQTLHERAPAELRLAIVELATGPMPESDHLLAGTLGLLQTTDDHVLDDQLCKLIESDQVTEACVERVSQFALSRSPSGALQACLSSLKRNVLKKNDRKAVAIAVAMIQQHPTACWQPVIEIMNRRATLMQTMLETLAEENWQRSFDEQEVSWLQKLDFTQIGQLVTLLLKCFPPERDAKRKGVSRGLPNVTQDLRDRLISLLGDQRDAAAVAALRSIEKKFGKKYPWLRRPRARAERAFRLSQWTPLPIRVVAQLLDANEKRLIRSEEDAIEGVVAAIKQYGDRLRHQKLNDLDDLWNRPKGRLPTPKEEERVSDKVCEAIRQYFRDYAVTADREVQVFRRKLSTKRSGAPGSEVDVLCRVPAATTVKSDPISIPVEVKLAHNHEVDTSFQDQLVTRYMSELGTNVGIYCVVWFGDRSLPKSYRPKWKSINEMQHQLDGQVSKVNDALSGVDARVIVIDASLPALAKSRRATKPRQTPKRAAVTASKRPKGSRRKNKKQVRAENRNVARKPKPKASHSEKGAINKKGVMKPRKSQKY